MLLDKSIALCGLISRTIVRGLTIFLQKSHCIT